MTEHPNSDQAERLMAMTEEQLFAEIGKALIGDEFGAVRLTEAEAARAGRSWFTSVLPTIREKVCASPTIDSALLSDTAAYRNTAVIAVLETLLQNVFYGVPVLTIAHAVACYGLHKLCAGSTDDVA